MRIVDLTLALRGGMRGVEWEQATTVERQGWNARTWHLYSHAGTHMDAPAHFAAGPGTIDTLPLERCCGPAWVAWLPEIAEREWITPGHLGAVAERIAEQPGQSLLLRTDWWRHVDDPRRYRDGLPRISDELAHWCVEQRVKLLGVEPPSVADVNDLEEVTRIHRILLGAEITIVEGLAHLDELSQPQVHFQALPLKLAGGDGSPCRAIAIEGA